MSVAHLGPDFRRGDVMSVAGVKFRERCAPGPGFRRGDIGASVEFRARVARLRPDFRRGDIGERVQP